MPDILKNRLPFTILERTKIRDRQKCRLVKVGIVA